MTEERWLPIPGFDGYYEASDLGRVRSVDRCVTGPVLPGRRRSYKGRVLSARPLNHPDGRPGVHLQVTLSADAVRHHMLVHTLVILAFVGLRPDGMQICHKNGDGTDNRLSNLLYGSASDNALDMVRHGSHNNARKTHCKRGHPFDETNTLVKEGKWRECRTCKRATWHRYKERKMMRSANVPTS